MPAMTTVHGSMAGPLRGGAMSMGKRRMAHYEEYDAYTGWRHVLCYIQRAGVRKAIKRSTHKRERREGKREAL